MKLKRIIPSLLGSLLLLFSWIGMAAFAETPLPDGAVKGLPERLAALDDKGNPVNSATGEFFFHVEDMKLGEVYTKNVQIMNLREDKSYRIYFCVEPLFKNGEIDLEAGCSCRFLMDGEEFFTGTVNGEGNIDLTQYYDCGVFTPGASHTLRCEISFNEMSVNRAIDNGWRLVDVDGVHVLRGPDGTGYAFGEIEFKWIFCAKVEEGTGPNTDDDEYHQPHTESGDNGFFPPYTGILLQNGRIWLLCMAFVAVLILGLLVLIRKNKKGQRK